jgi:hypothetical protein
MRRQALIALAIVLATPLGAACATPPAGGGEASIKGAFGKTILETYPDGRRAEIWLKADGTYTGEGRRHDRSNGRWTASGGRLCFKQAHPFVFGASFCTPIPGVGINKSWRAKSATGEAITVKVLPGHVVPS